MAKNSSDDLSYYLLLERSRKQDLAGIRHWNNLKLAFENEFIWIKDFTTEQIESLEVKSIPFKTIFECHDAKLHTKGSRLPDRNVPEVPWTGITRALPIKLPSFNHHFFGFDNRIPLKIVPGDSERPAVAMVVELRYLQPYIDSAPAIRLKNLQWAIMNNDRAFLLGTPMLPIQGQGYWLSDRSFIPAGYDFEFPFLGKEIERWIDPENNCWLLWSTDATYAPIDKSDLQPLSISSFRKSEMEHRLETI